VSDPRSRRDPHADDGVLLLVSALEDSIAHLRAPGPELPFYGQDASGDDDGYAAFVASTAPDIDALSRRVEALIDPPAISIVIPVYKPDLEFLRRCVESVRAQVYTRWELCLCDDGSNDPALTAALAEFARSDDRIKVTALAANGGISAATNGALDLATGDYVAFMDQDDAMTVDALAEAAITIAEHGNVDIVYTDEDKIDEHDRRYAPFFKPDWSPDYLLTSMYVGHLSVVRRGLVEQVGRLRSAFDGSQDHDLMLRLTEQARTILHIHRVLYHWRAIEGSAATSSDAKPWAHEAGYRAVASALERRGETAEVLPGPFPGARRVRRSTANAPEVTAIIPFRDGADLLHRCLESLSDSGGYPRWNAVLIDNGSWEPETKALLRQLDGDDRFTVVRDDSPFNWSALNNRGAQLASGDLLLFMNNDVEGTSEGWLDAMVEHAIRPEVGAVGARLVYPDGTVQHAGLIIGMGGIAGHAFRYCPPWYPGYFGMTRVTRNYTAVTGACMMVRRGVFDECEGFDEVLAVAYNDVDFCLRLRERGYLVVVTPYAELVHRESVTRGEGSDTDEHVEMFKRWRKIYEVGDPYFNRNLSLAFSEFRLGAPDEPPPWQRFLETAP